MNYIGAGKDFTDNVVHTPMDVKNKHFKTYIYITFKFRYSWLFFKNNISKGMQCRISASISEGYVQKYNDDVACTGNCA